MRESMASRFLTLLIALLLAVKCSTATNCNQTGNEVCGSNSHCNAQGVCECDPNNFSPTGRNTNCINEKEPDQRCNVYDPECVYCGPVFEGPCQKCANFIQDATCINECTDFMITIISNITSKICNDQTIEGQGGLPEWAIIVIAAIGVVLVLTGVSIITGFSVLIVNRSSHGRFDVEDFAPKSESATGTLTTKPSNSFSYEDDKEKSEDVQYNPTYKETDADEETLFMQKLEHLRKYAETFLKMLNDMRRRLKELSPDAPTAQQYRNVMRDITRLLYLLNKKPSNVEMPADGIMLLDWSEKILTRYLKSQGVAANKISVLEPQDETHF